jgi:hypothetical protein
LDGTVDVSSRVQPPQQCRCVPLQQELLVTLQLPPLPPQEFTQTPPVDPPLAETETVDELVCV